MLSGLPKAIHQAAMGLDSGCNADAPRASFPLPAATSAEGRKPWTQASSKVIILPQNVITTKKGGRFMS